MTLGISPESLTSLVPMTVRVDEVSALASAGANSSTAAVTQPRTGAATSRRSPPRRPRGSPGLTRRPREGEVWFIGPLYRRCLGMHPVGKTTPVRHRCAQGAYRNGTDGARPAARGALSSRGALRRRDVCPADPHGATRRVRQRLYEA